jgi:hypothetical protein
MAMAADVLALIAAPAPVVPVERLRPADMVRLVAAGNRLGAVRDELAARQRRVAGRLAAVRTARRAGPPAGVLVDRRG